MGNAVRGPQVVPPNSNDTLHQDLLQSHELPESDMLVVTHDYPSPNISEPIYRTGEKLRILSEEGCWWKVCSVLNEHENYIPNNHVARVYHSWLFEGVDRQKSEELLRLPGNRIGSFMIRENNRHRGVYSLSVRHRAITHYRILRLPNHWYYISPRLTFQCLEDLVNHYSDSADGLCCVLSTPCLALAISPLSIVQAPPVIMRRTLDWRNINRPNEANQRGHAAQDNQTALMSFGLRDSIASYLALTRSEEPSRKTSCKASRKKKSKSMYALPNYDYQRPFEQEEEEGDLEVDY